jgi:hypothetical protein
MNRAKHSPYLRLNRFTARPLTPLLMLVIAGCLSSEPQTLPSATPTEFAALAQEIAKFRQLPLKREITLTNFTPIESAADDYAPFQTRHVESAYRAIGLLSNHVDLGKALVDYRQLERLATYNESTATAALASNASVLGAPFKITDPISAREAPLSFAILAALHEQHFQWQGKTSALNLEDRRLAFRALATGDAALTVIARSAGKNIDALSGSDLQNAGRFALELEKSAARLPDYLRHRLLFPYREGSQFVLWAIKAKGWQGVNALYANPPLSTAQILHPKKYFSQFEAPSDFFPAGLISVMKDGPLVEQTIGEYLLRAMIATELPAKLASAIASSWRGDQLYGFQDGENFVTVWFSTWNSEQDAAAFQRSYRAVLENRQRIRFEMSAEKPAPSLSAPLRNGDGVTLQVKGSIVMLLSGVAAHRLSAVAEAAWRDLEVEPESTALRFDSASRNKRRRSMITH